MVTVWWRYDVVQHKLETRAAGIKSFLPTTTAMMMTELSEDGDGGATVVVVVPARTASPVTPAATMWRSAMVLVPPTGAAPPMKSRRVPLPSMLPPLYVEIVCLAWNYCRMSLSWPHFCHCLASTHVCFVSLCVHVCVCAYVCV